jgi:hypothetical protein
MLLPIMANGRIRLVNVEGTGEKDVWQAQEEQARQQGIARRRAYYHGEQFDDENWAAAKACGIDPWTQRMPEHERKHAYSTQIAESVNFIADQLAEGFRLTPAADQVAELVAAVAANTEILNGGDDDEDLVCDELLNEALVTGDVPYEVLWDPINELPFVQFWDAEQVEIDNPYGQHIEQVTRTEVIWVDDPTPGQDGKKQVTERAVYGLHLNERFVMECRRDTYWDNDPDPRESRWLGVPMVPWGVLRGNKRGLRGFRGDSIVTSQCMDTADRYNAVEQHSYLIARYNSHGNLVITGDGALLQLKDSSKVSKDVADVLLFPGGTTAVPLTLPTDPQMIEHQRKVCSDAIYASFGLVRVEPDTLSSLGGVSGYALEILNRKSEGTFRRIRRYWRKSWIQWVNLILDVTAYSQAAPISVLDVETREVAEPDRLAELGIDFDDPELIMPDGLMPVVLFEQVNPLEVYPDRNVEVEMASGYIVDNVQIRDDYTAKLITRKQALKQRGYRDDEIQDMLDDFEAQAPEVGTFGGLTVIPGQQGAKGTQAPGQSSTARA